MGSQKPEKVPVPAEHVLLIEHLSEAPLSAAQLQIWTGKDPLLVQVIQYIRVGWHMGMGHLICVGNFHHHEHRCTAV